MAGRKKIGQSKRQLVIDRAEGLCQAGGFHAETCSEFGSTIHHVEPGNNDTDLLLWVHWRCHQRIHKHESKAISAGLLRKVTKPMSNAEYALMLGVSKNEVQRLRRAGKLEARVAAARS